MINNYAVEISKIYEIIRNEEIENLRNRRNEITKRLPKVMDIETEISKLCVELAVSTFKEMDNREAHLLELKNSITSLRQKKAELLVENGYDMDYLSLKYRCPLCKDAGFIGNVQCSCYKQKLVKVYYNNSELRDILEVNNFDNFNLEYYSNRRSSDEPESPRKNIEKVLDRSMKFIKEFNDTNANLLFFGNSGTGKTFLTHCIAKELLDKGYLVVYRTSDELIQNLKDIKFNNNSSLDDLINNCDLLIIDDLGTEQVTEFSKSELFNLINKRLLKQKKMIVSTNYSLEGLLKFYSERISSRLLGNFEISKFFGDDIRIMKNLSKIKNP